MSGEQDDPVRVKTVADQADGSLLTHVTRRAMATDFVVLLPAHLADAVEVVVAALEKLEAIEQSLTIYRDDSEVSKVNRLAATAPVALSDSTYALLRKAVSWSQLTGGAFDITAGPLVEAWGFTRRSGRKPSEEQIEQARRSVGYQQIELCDSARTIRFAKTGMSINLGAIGKGDALDQIVDDLRQHEVHDFLIHGGSSSIVAWGDQVRGSDQGWPVGIAHPTKPKRRLGGLWLRNQSLATSGSGKQFFHHRGRRYGHVIDPRTGYPAGDLLSLTVIMESAADADACATGLFVQGVACTKDFAIDDKLVPLVTVRSAGRQDAVEVDWQGDIRWINVPEDGVSRSGDGSDSG